MSGKKVEAERPVVPRGLTSAVWTYFRLCEDDPVVAECSLCGVRMSRGGTAPNRCGTTNLRRHVLYTHHIDLPSTKRRGPELGKKSSRNRKQSGKLASAELRKKSSPRRNSAQVAEKRSCSPESQDDEVKGEPDPVMCIKWNTYLTNMTTTLPSLLQDEEFTDVTLACEGQSLKCHKVLLAACSPYFYDLLSSAACKHPIIVFKDYQFWELQALVAFMYCGEVSVAQSQLPSILRVAEALQVKGLAKPASSPEQESSDAELTKSSSEDINSSLEPSSPSTEPTKPSTATARSKSRKRKLPSKSLLKSEKLKHKLKTGNFAKSKPRPKKTKRKTVISPPKKLSLQSAKRQPPKNRAVKEEDSKDISEAENMDQNVTEFLPSDLPDMLSDILAVKDPDNISLSEVDRGLGDLDGMKMDLGDDIIGIGPVVANGVLRQDHFDLLPQISSECKLDEYNESGR